MQSSIREVEEVDLYKIAISIRPPYEMICNERRIS
jgi:hypothetical protein